MLRATTACTFSTSQLPKVVRSSSALSILTWKCASRHNGVHFFMSHLASWLRTRRFSEPTFRPSGATNHWKNTVNRDFPIFSRIYLFFLLIFSLLTLLTSAFQLSILSEVSLLNFLRLYIYLGKLKSRMNQYNIINEHVYGTEPASLRSTLSNDLSSNGAVMDLIRFVVHVQVGNQNNLETCHSELPFLIHYDILIYHFCCS